MNGKPLLLERDHKSKTDRSSPGKTLRFGQVPEFRDKVSGKLKWRWGREEWMNRLTRNVETKDGNRFSVGTMGNTM